MKQTSGFFLHLCRNLTATDIFLSLSFSLSLSLSLSLKQGDKQL